MRRTRNPDAANLVRADRRVIGALTALLIVMKGLPLAYQKDMQGTSRARWRLLRRCRSRSAP